MLDRDRKKESRKRVFVGEDIIISFMHDRGFVDQSIGCGLSLGAFGCVH